MTENNEVQIIQNSNGANNYIQAKKIIDKLRLVDKLNNNVAVPLSAIKSDINYIRDALESQHNIITVVKNDRLERWQ